MAQLYDKIWMPRGHPSEVNERESVFENLNVQNKFVLDLGAGTLRFSLDAVQRGAKRVVAIDMERDMLEWGIKKAKNLGMKEKIDVVTADARYLPFLGSLFDTVIAMELFQNIKSNAHLFVLEVHRVLKTSGKAVIGAWNAIPRIIAGFLGFTERGTEIWKVSSSHCFGWEHYYRYDYPWQLKRLLIFAYFSSVKIVGVHSMYFVPLYEMVTKARVSGASKLLRLLIHLQVTIDKLFRKLCPLNQITGRILLAILIK